MLPPLVIPGQRHLDVVLVDLAEELVAAEAAKPRDPADLFRAAHLPE